MNAVHHLWHHHYRPILLTLALITILIWVLALTQPRKLLESVYTIQAGKCYVDYHATIQAVALACPGVEYIRLWPLPVVQPWPDPTDKPEPWSGWLARR